MLPKDNRLNIRTYYSEIRGNGKKIYDPLFSLYFRQQLVDSPPKLNVIISKKIAKAAVKRNRMRRLVHQSVQDLLPHLKPGFEGLFFVHKDFADESSATISEKIKAMLFYGNLYQD